MARSKSSGRWLKEHFDDQYVKRSQEDGYRSRASYKLLELHEKDRLFKPGMSVIDLGAAPGGWSQVAAELVGWVLSFGPDVYVESPDALSERIRRLHAEAARGPDPSTWGRR